MSTAANLTHEEAIREVERLRGLNEQLTALVDRAPTMLWVKDEEATILYCNEAYAKWFEKPREDIIGTSAYDRYNENEKAVAIATDKRILSENKPVELIETFEQDCGDKQYLLTFKAPLTINGKRCITGVSIDRTTNIVSQKNLQGTLQRYQETIHVRDRLLTILGHDIRSPLSSVISMCDIVANQPECSQCGSKKELVTELEAQASQVLSMVDDMLTWIRNQEEHLEANCKAVQVGRIIQDCIGLYSRAIEAKDLALNIDLGDHTTAYSDHDMLQVVFRNILSNAIKFTPRGGKIDIKLFRVGASQIRFSISDTGKGINKEIIQNLKVPKDGLKKTRGTEKESGLGLGLRLCIDLIERMNGQIEFIPQDPGTLIQVTVPAVDLESNLKRTIYRSESKIHFTQAELRKLEKESSENNQKLRVTGVLLYRNGVFIQQIEGHETTVEELYHRIVRDHRHHHILLLKHERIDRRLFPDWNMRLFEGDEYVDFSELLKAPESEGDAAIIDMVETLFLSTE